MTNAQASYALARARVELRLAELREALDQREAERRWDEHEALERVEHGLAELERQVEER